MRSAALLLVLLLSLGAQRAEARMLEVGAGRPFSLPSAAAAAAQTGDVIKIDSGTYDDCAVWRANGLVIEGADPERVIIGNRSCDGKGVFVIAGNDVTVRGVTLTGARSADSNGAGIRAEGINLTVERVRFLGNENGILHAGVRRGALIVRDSAFIGNGSCEQACAHGIYVGPARVTARGEFAPSVPRAKAIMSSRVPTGPRFSTHTIEDGPEGTSSYLIDIPNGGEVLLRGNRLSKGARSSNRSTAISIGAEGVDRPTPKIRVESNVLSLEGNYRTVFVTNHTTTASVLKGNTLPPAVEPPSMWETSCIGPGDVLLKGWPLLAAWRPRPTLNHQTAGGSLSDVHSD